MLLYGRAGHPNLAWLVGAQACKQKVEGSIPPARGSNRAPISGGGVLLETEARFPAPCRGNRGSVSRETTGQVALLKTLGRHRAAPTMCVSARDVNITWHRTYVQMQETSTSQSIMDFCCVGKIYVALWRLCAQFVLCASEFPISNIID